VSYDGWVTTPQVDRPYLTNEMGDIYAATFGGVIEPFEPEAFNWGAGGGKTVLDPALRRSLDQVASLPGFTVTEGRGYQAVPGPRPPRSGRWLGWPDGSAPPAAVESKGGAGGTLGYFDRLSDALGHTVDRLPRAPERSPFVVHDFVGGRRFTVAFIPPPLQPGGAGLVYVLDDGDSFKIGHTTGLVAVRVAGLQTGNPRLIRTIATVGPAGEDVEVHLHTQFGRWNRRGEWFRRAPLLALAQGAGGWPQLLAAHLPQGDWLITLYDEPYVDSPD
jgi:hypothetical protein